MRIVFERAHSSLCRVETRAAALENFVTSRQGTLQSGAIFALAFRRHIASLDSAGAAVDRESNFLRFHVFSILRALFRCSCERPRWFLGERPESFRDARPGTNPVHV